MKTFEIRIKTTEEALKDFAHTFEAVKAGKRVRKREGVYFTSVEAARNLLTPERIKLLTLIHHQGPQSIYQLARICNRDPKNVHEDIKLLERYGILRTRLRTRASRTQRVSEVLYDEINLRIPLTAHSKTA
jgi:predicted transcriptional regulator